jgi:hypothetical protein
LVLTATCYTFIVAQLDEGSVARECTRSSTQLLRKCECAIWVLGRLDLLELSERTRRSRRAIGSLAEAQVEDAIIDKVGRDIVGWLSAVFGQQSAGTTVEYRADAVAWRKDKRGQSIDKQS